MKTALLGVREWLRTFAEQPDTERLTAKDALLIAATYVESEFRKPQAYKGMTAEQSSMLEYLVCRLVNWYRGAIHDFGAFEPSPHPRHGVAVALVPGRGRSESSKRLAYTSRGLGYETDPPQRADAEHGSYPNTILQVDISDTYDSVGMKSSNW